MYITNLHIDLFQRLAKIAPVFCFWLETKLCLAHTCQEIYNMLVCI